MIHGVHTIIYAKDPEKARAFFRDVLKFPSVDAGGGWLIFALPPAELGVHPAEESGEHLITLMCDDLHATIADLKKKGVKFTRGVQEQEYGLVTALEIPGGGELGLYQPTHPSPIAKKKS